ncbi:hypothetical protein [Nostoc parmelioides]|nr:hypothetical protein [Nostoc parmelioides]
MNVYAEILNTIDQKIKYQIHRIDVCTRKRSLIINIDEGVEFPI